MSSAPSTAPFSLGHASDKELLFADTVRQLLAESHDSAARGIKLLNDATRRPSFADTLLALNPDFYLFLIAAHNIADPTDTVEDLLALVKGMAYQYGTAFLETLAHPRAHTVQHFNAFFDDVELTNLHPLGLAVLADIPLTPDHFEIITGIKKQLSLASAPNSLKVLQRVVGSKESSSFFLSSNMLQYFAVFLSSRDPSIRETALAVVLAVARAADSFMRVDTLRSIVDSHLLDNAHAIFLSGSPTERELLVRVFVQLSLEEDIHSFVFDHHFVPFIIHQLFIAPPYLADVLELIKNLTQSEAFLDCFANCGLPFLLVDIIRNAPAHDTPTVFNVVSILHNITLEESLLPECFVAQVRPALRAFLSSSPGILKRIVDLSTPVDNRLRAFETIHQQPEQPDDALLSKAHRFLGTTAALAERLSQMSSESEGAAFEERSMELRALAKALCAKYANNVDLNHLTMANVGSFDANLFLNAVEVFEPEEMGDITPEVVQVSGATDAQARVFFVCRMFREMSAALEHGVFEHEQAILHRIDGVVENVISKLQEVLAEGDIRHYFNNLPDVQAVLAEAQENVTSAGGFQAFLRAYYTMLASQRFWRTFSINATQVAHVSSAYPPEIQHIIDVYESENMSVGVLLMQVAVYVDTLRDSIEALALCCKDPVAAEKYAALRDVCERGANVEQSLCGRLETTAVEFLLQGDEVRKFGAALVQNTRYAWLVLVATDKELLFLRRDGPKLHVESRVALEQLRFVGVLNEQAAVKMILSAGEDKFTLFFPPDTNPEPWRACLCAGAAI